ncbi:MAG: hypothetical protein D3X82_16805 [Candidatus Leucobacter sulfamidivorax]|nr:hypothetical protein [Candidatus Leucobacter sulfamidivorax]
MSIEWMLPLPGESESSYHASRHRRAVSCEWSNESTPVCTPDPDQRDELEAPKSATISIEPSLVKMTIEALNAAYAHLPLDNDQYRPYLLELSKQLGKHRPVGADGKHGDLHTETCGCEEKPFWRHKNAPCDVHPSLSEAIRCDYCGDELPAVKHRSHMPTPPSLQRLGFDAEKVVCPECVVRRRLAPPDREKLAGVFYDAWNNEDGNEVPYLSSEARLKLADSVLAALAVSPAPARDESPGAALIAAERATHPGRGFDAAHDALPGHRRDLIRAAICYVCAEDLPEGTVVPLGWPWGRSDWKPSGIERNLVKAGALIAAAIDALPVTEEERPEPVAKRCDAICDGQGGTSGCFTPWCKCTVCH